MKHLHRLLTLSLAAGLLFTAVACSKPTDDPSETAGETTAVSEDETASPYVTDLPDTDLGGGTITFLVQKDPCFIHFYDVNVTTYNDGVINQAVYDRNRTVESKLHVTITDVDGGGDDSAPGYLKRAVQSGDADYDAVWLKTDHFFSATLEGYNANIVDVANLDLTKLYWEQNAQEDYRLGDKLFGIMGDISTSANMFTHLFGVNKKVAVEHGIQLRDIYATVLRGDWTLDAFLEICSACEWADLNGNGKRDGLDLFAFGTSPSYIFGGFSAAGEKWIVKDEEGQYVLSELTQRKIDVLQKIVDFTNDQSITVAYWNIGSIPEVTNTYAYVYRNKFENNTILFSDLDMGEVLDTRSTMKDDFGIVPLPKYDTTQKDYSVYAYQFFPVLSVPSNVSGEQCDRIGYVLEVLASESYKTLTPVFYDVAMGGMVLRDEESTKMLDIILRSRRYELLMIYQWGNDGFYNAIRDMITSGKCNITSAYTKSARQLNRSIDQVRKKAEGLG